MQFRIHGQWSPCLAKISNKIKRRPSFWGPPRELEGIYLNTELYRGNTKLFHTWPQLRRRILISNHKRRKLLGVVNSITRSSEKINPNNPKLRHTWHAPSQMHQTFYQMSQAGPGAPSVSPVIMAPSQPSSSSPSEVAHKGWTLDQRSI